MGGYGTAGFVAPALAAGCMFGLSCSGRANVIQQFGDCNTFFLMYIVGMKQPKRKPRRDRLITVRMFTADVQAIDRLAKHLDVSRSRALEVIVNDWKAYRIGAVA